MKQFSPSLKIRVISISGSYSFEKIKPRDSIETVFSVVRNNEFKLFFEDLIQVGSEAFWLKLLSILNDIDHDCSVILDYLPTGLNVESPNEKNYFSKNIQNVFDFPGNSKVTSL